jgi:hypothetical protein
MSSAQQSRNEERKRKFYHEGHEVEKFKIFTSESFVAFVFFVVRSKVM